jgi:hypothetical protein
VNKGIVYCNSRRVAQAEFKHRISFSRSRRSDCGWLSRIIIVPVAEAVPDSKGLIGFSIVSAVGTLQFP